MPGEAEGEPEDAPTVPDRAAFAGGVVFSKRFTVSVWLVPSQPGGTVAFRSTRIRAGATEGRKKELDVGIERIPRLTPWDSGAPGALRAAGRAAGGCHGGRPAGRLPGPPALRGDAQAPGRGAEASAEKGQDP